MKIIVLFFSLTFLSISKAQPEIFPSWDNFSAQEKKIIQRKLTWINQLPPQKKEKFIRRLKRLQEVPSAKRKKLLNRLRRNIRKNK